MLTPLKTEVLKVDDLSHEARRFRTILWSFEKNLELLFKDTGLSARVDHAALANAFSKWRQAFDKTKHLADVNRHDFVIYAAGLMLKELVAAEPLRTVNDAPEGLPSLPDHVDHRLKRWPEGYAYTSFCLSVATAILKEMGDEEPVAAKSADDLAFWDSFREHAAESPAMAVAFFDVVCGQKPNWDAPDVAWLRRSFQQKDKLIGP
jgi:hypothetical protein